MYVFDSSSLIVIFNHYYPGRFPSFWEKFEALIRQGKFISVREVFNEINIYSGTNRLKQWAKENRPLFEEPSIEELAFVEEIFSNQHFQYLIEQKKILEGRPVADPFLIAKAKVLKSTLVTQETFKENAAKMPNVCAYYKIKYTNLEHFMEREHWEF